MGRIEFALVLVFVASSADPQRIAGQVSDEEAIRGVVAEYIAAARYYEDQAEGLGTRFIEATELTYGRVAESPNTGQPFGTRLRRTLVPGFPYGLLYSVEPPTLPRRDRRSRGRPRRSIGRAGGGPVLAGGRG